MILIETLGKNELVQHPKGGTSFGIIPEVPQHNIREGSIYLRKGDHWELDGKQQGFGVVHIWEMHQYDLHRLGFRIIEDVAAYVALLTQPATPIYCEIQKPVKGRRLTVLRSHTGILALEPRQDRSGFGYFVVSAYPKKQAKGVCIGLTR